jgi:hypothetical protein
MSVVMLELNQPGRRQAPSMSRRQYSIHIDSNAALLSIGRRETSLQRRLDWTLALGWDPRLAETSRQCRL